VEMEQGLSSVELWKMLRNVRKLDDTILIEEIFGIIKKEHSEKTQKILSKYLKTGKFTKLDRDALIAHYILHWMDDSED